MQEKTNVRDTRSRNREKKSLFSRWLEPYTVRREDAPGDKAKLLLLLLVLAVLLFFSRFFVSQPNVTYVALSIHGKNYLLEYVSRKADMKRGLRYRAPIHARSGMFFDLMKPRIITVSMDGVNFPLTVITLNARMVVEVAHLEPGSRHAFTEPAHYFVEINVRGQVRPRDFLYEYHPIQLSPERSPVRDHGAVLMYREFINTLPAYGRELYTLLDPMIEPIKDLLADPEISEIFIYANDRVVYRKKGRDFPHDKTFRPNTLRNLILQVGTFNGRAIRDDPVWEISPAHHH